MNPFRRLIGGRHQRASLPEQHLEEAIVPVLAITTDDKDRRLLSEFAASGRWDLTLVGSVQEALSMLKNSQPVVVLCARELVCVDWRQAFDHVTAVKPKCALILISSTYDDGLWDQVVQQGGYDVLKTPLRQDQTISAVNLAWLYARSGRGTGSR